MKFIIWFVKTNSNHMLQKCPLYGVYYRMHNHIYQLSLIKFFINLPNWAASDINLIKQASWDLHHLNIPKFVPNCLTKNCNMISQNQYQFILEKYPIYGVPHRVHNNTSPNSHTALLTCFAWAKRSRWQQFTKKFVTWQLFNNTWLFLCYKSLI